MERKSYRYIAERLGLSVNTVKSYCARHDLGDNRIMGPIPSRNTRLKSKREPHPLVGYCIECGTVFKQCKNGSRKFCSRLCYGRWHRKHGDGKFKQISIAADYAEYFEWQDGNAVNEDRVGYFVTIDGDMIKKASDNDDYILGVVSGNPCILGNGDCDVWNGRLLRDDFRRVVMEEDDNGGHAKINPEYDNTRKYINRADRPEWSAVGMLGVLPVRHDGTLKVNGYATVNSDGIATACNRSAANAYRVIKIKSAEVAEIIFR